MNVIEVRDEQFLIRVGDDIISKPNSPYYQCKLNADNNRIAHTFGKNMHVQETFNKRIFNCTCGTQKLQFRQDLSDELSMAILNHIKYGRVMEYKELFDRAMREVPQYDILEYYLNGLDGVECLKSGYIIDDIFMVDFKGNARFALTNDWQYLCLVAAKISPDPALVNEDGVLVKVNSLTMTIISKIMFLLSPNTSDSVFMNQLPKNIRVILEAGGDSQT